MTLYASGRIAEGVTETVLRRDIATISGSGLSLMLEGVETAISVEEMADLIAFLSSEGFKRPWLALIRMNEKVGRKINALFGNKL